MFDRCQSFLINHLPICLGLEKPKVGKKIKEDLLPNQGVSPVLANYRTCRNASVLVVCCRWTGGALII